MRTTHAGATTFCALVALVAAVLVVGPTASNAQVTIQDIGEDNPVFGVPSKTAEGCGATLQNSTSDLIIAFSSCLASESASEACCGAIESTFAFENDKFGGCLCHPVLINTVTELAESFLPGSKELIPAVMNDCVASGGNYSARFAFYGQKSGMEQCDPSVTVDTESVDVGILGGLVPTVGAQSKDSEDGIGSAELEAAFGKISQDQNQSAPAVAESHMDTALTVFSVLTVEDCGANLQEGKGQLIGALTPCIIAEAPTKGCCAAVEKVFRPDNPDFGRCLCHKEVMDGIFEEAEGFLPGSTSLIEDAFRVCTDEFGSQFPFHGQKIGHVSCGEEEVLESPSMAQAEAGASEQEGEDANPLSALGEIFGSPNSNSASASQASAALSALFAVALALALAV